MKVNRLLSFAAVIASLAGCTPEDPDRTQNENETPDVPEATFAKGADISWVTEMEKDGQKFYNSEGKETECTPLMK